MIRNALALCCAAALLGGCATYHDVKDLKYVGFSDDASHGKSVGQIESDDCVYRLFGYNLGSQPDISTAIANARTGTKSSLTDVAGGTSEGSEHVRYVDHLTARNDGFNAYIFGKSCINVKGAGYL